jgi:hypothetical protein
MNDKLERVWKEAVVAYFKVISRHLPGGTDENQEIFIQDSRSGPRFEPGTSRI